MTGAIVAYETTFEFIYFLGVALDCLKYGLLIESRGSDRRVKRKALNTTFRVGNCCDSQHLKFAVGLYDVA
jgi:hypothetical protein